MKLEDSQNLDVMTESGSKMSECSDAWKSVTIKDEKLDMTIESCDVMPNLASEGDSKGNKNVSLLSPDAPLLEKEEPLPGTILPPLPGLQPLEEPEAIPGPSKKKRKVGLYMLGPFDDPEQEKKRLNALNAYKNRVKNKRLTQDLREKNNKLEHVNVQCSKALKKITSERKLLQQEIKDRGLERSALEEELKRKENEVREQREKLALFRGHMDLIANSLDEDNPARKLITTLLNRLPYEGQN